MATKKVEETKVNEEVKEIKEATKKVEEIITVNIPIDPLNPTDKEIIVGINDKYAKIIRGEETKISRPVYEILKEAKIL